MKSETVAEIAEKMTAFALDVQHATDGCAPDVADNIATGIKDFAGRLEAACKRCPVDTYLRRIEKQKSINNELVDENAALLAKLKIAEELVTK